MPRTQTTFHAKLSFTDKYDNFYLLKQEPLHGNCRIYLKLKGDIHEKMIAEIDVKHRCMVVKRVKEKHFYRALCGYGFNWTLVNERLPMQIDNVLLIEHDNGTTDHYLIPLQDIRSRGEKKHFGKSGYELQWFVHMNVLIEYRIKNEKFAKGILESL